jgi:hypothetical protein
MPPAKQSALPGEIKGGDRPGCLPQKVLRWFGGRAHRFLLLVDESVAEKFGSRESTAEPGGRQGPRAAGYRVADRIEKLHAEMQNLLPGSDQRFTQC